MKFGLWIRGQYAEQDSLRQRFLETVEQVRLARDVGFKMISAGQHYLNAPYQEIHWSPLLSRLAAESGDMRLATSIVILPLHNPVEMAEEVASLDVICDGRFVFGVGLGYKQSEFDAFGVQLKDRVPRFVEAVELMRRLWTEDRVTFEGKFFQVRDAGIGVRPIQKPPPIWGGLHRRPGGPESRPHGNPLAGRREHDTQDHGASDGIVQRGREGRGDGAA